MEFGEFLINCMLLISITFSEIQNPVGKNGMKKKIKVQRTIEKTHPFFYLN
jgi:flagellar basal body-associated protein FliL